MTTSMPFKNSDASNEQGLVSIVRKEREIGYVWVREAAGINSSRPVSSPLARVIIIVDDFFDVPVWYQHGIFPSAHAYGLPILLDYAKQSEDVHAIGFFDLPDSEDPEACQAIIQGMHQWIDSLGLTSYACYLLVDFYFGEGFVNREFGSGFVERWQQSPPFSAKLAHLTIGGRPNVFGNPSGVEIFSKANLQDRGGLSEDLLKWLDDSPHPLDLLWNTHGICSWFADDRSVMKHDIANVSEFFFGHRYDAQKSAQYKKNVEKALGFPLPSAWWQNQTLLKHLHGSLKSLCGAYACSHASQGDSRRNLSVGGAFLIAMMAHYEIYGHITPFLSQDIWPTKPQQDAIFLPIQTKQIAQGSVKALYEFFRCVFTPQGGSIADLNAQNKSWVKQVFFSDDGKHLKFQLRWQKEQHRNLSEMLERIFNRESVSPVPQSSANTRDAIIRLWNCLAISETGFGSPGCVRMHYDEVIISSTE
jgi:hypothetical protein